MFAFRGHKLLRMGLKLRMGLTFSQSLTFANGFAGINFRGFRQYRIFAGLIFAGINFRVFQRDSDGSDLKMCPKYTYFMRFHYLFRGLFSGTFLRICRPKNFHGMPNCAVFAAGSGISAFSTAGCEINKYRYGI